MPPNPCRRPGYLRDNQVIRNLCEWTIEMENASKQCDSLPHAISALNVATSKRSKRWFEDVRTQGAIIQKLMDNNNNTLLSSKTKHWDSIDQMTETVSEATTISVSENELVQEPASMVSELVESFALALRILRKRAGDVMVRNIIRAEFEQDILGDESSSRPVESVCALPGDLIAACRQNLPGGDKVTDWSIEGISKLIAEVGPEIRRIEQGASESQQIHKPHDQSKSRGSVKVSDTATARRTPVPDIQSDPKVRDCGANIRTSNAEKRDLELLLEESRRSLETATKNVRALKYIILRNREYGIHLDDTSISRISHELRGDFCNGIMEVLPTFSTLPTITMADVFDSKPLRPSQPYSVRYLQCLCEDIRLGDADSIYRDNQVNTAQQLAMQHIPWLSTRLAQILATNSQEDIHLLFQYLSDVVAGLELRGIARPCLFSIIAGLVRRATAPKGIQVNLWVRMYEGVVSKAYGLPYEEWDLIDRISFALFLSSGPSANLDELGLSRRQREPLQSLVLRLRKKTPSNMISFLKSESVMEFAKQEKVDGARSIILQHTYAEAELLIVRTCNGNSATLNKEHVWILHGDIIYYFDSGFKLSVDWDSSFQEISLRIKPSSTSPGICWFLIRDTDQALRDYIQRFYCEELRAAMKRSQGTIRLALSKKFAVSIDRRREHNLR